MNIIQKTLLKLGILKMEDGLCSGCGHKLTIHGWESKRNCYRKECPKYIWRGLKI